MHSPWTASNLPTSTQNTICPFLRTSVYLQLSTSFYTSIRQCCSSPAQSFLKKRCSTTIQMSPKHITLRLSSPPWKNGAICWLLQNHATKKSPDWEILKARAFWLTVWKSRSKAWYVDRLPLGRSSLALGVWGRYFVLWGGAKNPSLNLIMLERNFFSETIN